MIQITDLPLLVSWDWAEAETAAHSEAFGAEAEISDDKDHKGWCSGVPRGCVTLGMRGTVMLCAQQLSIHLPA